MKLPELPLPCGVARLYLSDGFKDVWTVGLVRAIQIAAARAALEEAAKVCNTKTSEQRIRSITIEGETP